MENSDIITEEQNKLAVQENGYTIRYIKEPSVEVQKLAVEEDAYAIKYIKKPSDEVQKLAVKQDGCTLRYVDNKTDEICKLAVQQNGLALQYIVDQTDEICELAIQQNPEAVIYRIEKWKTVNKLFDSNKDNTCSISYDNIELNDNYCSCLTCSNSFKADVLIKWVKKSKSCPMCRTLWTNNIIYNNINN
jgi:hypothetical protein